MRRAYLCASYFFCFSHVWQAQKKMWLLDEGVAVLYNSISELISERRFHNGGELQALIIDCGGGTTDLSSSRFTIFDQRIAYRIRIATAYENGDTDFGGNNLPHYGIVKDSHGTEP